MLYPIIILALIVFIYKLLFWLYTFQLKEYRFDRFKEYSFTKQWTKAFLNIFFVLEMPFLLISFLGIYQKFFWGFWWIIISEQLYKPILGILVLEFFYIILKFKTKKVFKPNFTSRAKIILILSILFFVLFWALIYFYINFLFSTFILFSIIFPYLFIFSSNILILPIINSKKNKFLNSAIEKSKKIDKPYKISITGSYWKSSIKEFLSQILANKYEVLATPKNTNTEMWVSDIILKELNNDFDFFVAELGAYRIGEIEILWEIVNHKDAFLTAIWNQHLWLFGSKQNIIIAKTEIIKKVIENNGILYANYDNPEIASIDFWKLNIVSYWLENTNAIAKSKITKQDVKSTIFEFNYKNYKHTFTTNLLWQHNVINLTWVIAFCLNNWMKVEEIEKAILNIKLPEDSYLVENIKIDNENWDFDLKIIASTRNLSVASLRTGVDILKNIEWKKILVMEDILELWKDAQEIHKNLWKQIWQTQISEIYFVWANYSNSFLEWLMEVYFEGNFSIDWISKYDIKDDSTIIFLWKKTNVYLKSFLWKSDKTHLEKKIDEAKTKEKEDIKELIKESEE